MSKATKAVKIAWVYLVCEKHLTCQPSIRVGTFYDATKPEVLSFIRNHRDCLEKHIKHVLEEDVDFKIMKEEDYSLSGID